MVAAFTGANVLDGTAVAAAAGSIVRLKGGGELASSARADGPVQIAIQPWELKIDDPRSSSVVDTVVSVRHERGALVIRLSRFTIQAPPAPNGRMMVFEGQTLGFRADPQSVRILADGSA
jgi:hypothetical protein